MREIVQSKQGSSEQLQGKCNVGQGRMEKAFS